MKLILFSQSIEVHIMLNLVKVFSVSLSRFITGGSIVRTERMEAKTLQSYNQR